MKIHQGLWFGVLYLNGAFLAPPFLAPAAFAESAADPYGNSLGTVEWTTSCRSEARPSLDRGLALLHHMTYRGARAMFEAAAAADPGCAMAYWGQAMTGIHPLWSDPPSEETFAAGQALADKAAAQPGSTPREEAMIAALRSYFAAGRSSSERPNLIAFAQGWEEAMQQFPADPEIRSFTALAVLATAEPEDKSYGVQRKASLIAESVLEEFPRHPGAHHYVIHANDLPALAGNALSVARSYGQIAPTVPHALHMPSHIFTRVGLWEESIDMNDRSARAALMHPAGEAVSLHYLHALDYMAYAHLQRGEASEAKAVADRMATIRRPLQTHLASGYTLAAVPARIALEQQNWSAAADLPVRQPETFPWDSFPAMEAISRFARALGAARSDRLPQARQELAILERLEAATRDQSSYWGKQVEIMRLSAQAWLLHGEGNREEALRTMRAAADLEASTEKHAVTPGEILPARELLGDMLMALARPEQAYEAYMTALERSPNRFNSLYGAALAAERMGRTERARQLYADVVAMVAPGAQSEQVRHARSMAN